MQYSRNNLTRKNNLKDFSYHIDLHGYACSGHSEGACKTSLKKWVPWKKNNIGVCHLEYRLSSSPNFSFKKVYLKLVPIRIPL